MQRLAVVATALLLAQCAAPPPERRVVAPSPQQIAPPAAAPRLEPAPSCAAAVDVAPIAPPELESSSGPSIENLERWVHALAGPELRGRQAGSTDALRAARSIADYFVALGATAPGSTGHCVPFPLAGGASDVNVIAHLPGPRSACSVVVGAHYDALGVDDRGRIRPGADDDASGVAVLLELGRLVAAGELRPRPTLVLAAFGAEEVGLLGSAAYVKSPSVPLDSVRLMINVDMAGRRPRGYTVVGYEAFGPERELGNRRVTDAAKRAAVRAIPMRLGDRSDSASFAPHVPTLFFSTTVHPDYHQPTDTPERVDYGQVLRVLELVMELVRDVECD